MHDDVVTLVNVYVLVLAFLLYAITRVVSNFYDHAVHTVDFAPRCLNSPPHILRSSLAVASQNLCNCLSPLPLRAAMALPARAWAVTQHSASTSHPSGSGGGARSDDNSSMLPSAGSREVAAAAAASEGTPPAS